VSQGSDIRAVWSKWLDENMKPEYKIFLGPCAHGRDPYDRCNHCSHLTPEAAKELAEAPRSVEFLEEPEL
jgi:hypothetical protein